MVPPLEAPRATDGGPGSSTEEVAASPRQGWGALKGPSDATIPSLRGAGWQPCPAPRSHLPLSSQFPRPVPAPSSQLPAPPCPPLARLSPQPRAPLPARCRRSPAGPSRAGRRWRSYRRIRTRGGGRSSSRPRSAPWRRAPGTRGCACWRGTAPAWPARRATAPCPPRRADTGRPAPPP